MSDETPIRPSGKADARNADEKRVGEQSPLQSRAAFVKNWDWQLVVSLNRGACERGRAQFGNNSETHERVRQKWEEARQRELSFGEFLDFLRQCHRDAPFLFFNGNTFAEVARRVVDAIFIEFPMSRRREAASLTAHYVAGVLDREAMVSGLESLASLVELKEGDRVKTLRGSTQGVVKEILSDGRVVWQPDGSGTTLTALPESLLRVTQ
jgi:hypothetical protein